MERGVQNKETHPAKSNLFSLNKPSMVMLSLPLFIAKACAYWCFGSKREAKMNNDLQKRCSCEVL